MDWSQFKIPLVGSQLMLFDPSDQFLSQKHPLLPDLMRGKPLPHKIVNRLVAHPQKSLRFLERQIDALDPLALFSFIKHVDFPRPRLYRAYQRC